VRGKDFEAALLFLFVCILVGPEFLDEGFFVRVCGGGDG
jgi:hypothetical protein